MHREWIHETRFTTSAALADFCGTRWQNNAIMVPVPTGKSFMMPVGMVMSLYRKHSGKQGVEVTATPDGLDVAASPPQVRVVRVSCIVNGYTNHDSQLPGLRTDHGARVEFEFTIGLEVSR